MKQYIFGLMVFFSSFGLKLSAGDQEVIAGRSFSFAPAENQWIEVGLDKLVPVLEKNTCIYKDWRWLEMFNGSDRTLSEILGLGQSVTFWYHDGPDADPVVFRVFRTTEYRQNALGTTVFPEGKSIAGRLFIREGSYWVEPPLSSKGNGVVDLRCVYEDQAWQQLKQANPVTARILALGTALVFYGPEKGRIVQVFPSREALVQVEKNGQVSGRTSKPPARSGALSKGWLIGGGAAAIAGVAVMSGSGDGKSASETRKR